MIPTTKPKAGITIGDVNGVGLEVILKSFAGSALTDVCTPLLYADLDTVTRYGKVPGIRDVTLHAISSEQAAREGVVNVFDEWAMKGEFEFGKETRSGGEYALESLQQACAALEDRAIDLMVTAPLNKNNIPHPGFTGHTGFLADKFSSEALMIMVSHALKIALVTGHIPVAGISSHITEDRVLKQLTSFNRSLKTDFGIEHPAIAVLGLNPHAGDGGLIGDEERRSIVPAIEKGRNAGINADGPISADGFFGSRGYQLYDGVLAMYHDQGLIPFKAISFDSGVNFTAGLPFVRTSPAHGVAYSLAGLGKASAKSFGEAVLLACDICKRRNSQQEGAE